MLMKFMRIKRAGRVLSYLYIYIAWGFECNSFFFFFFCLSPCTSISVLREGRYLSAHFCPTFLLRNFSPRKRLRYSLSYLSLSLSSSSHNDFTGMEHVERIVDRGKEGRKGGKTDNIKTFIEGGAKLVKHRVSIRVEHTIFRNCRIHRFLRSRRSQFPLSLSLCYFPSPPLGIELYLATTSFLLSRIHPRIPLAFTGNTTQGKPKMVTESALQRRSIPPYLLVPLDIPSRGRGRRDDTGLFDYILLFEEVLFFFFFGIISSKIIRFEDALKEGKASVRWYIRAI